MQLLSRVLVAISLAAAGGPGVAQVYETEDAEGHPVFSDKPSPGAQPVEVPPTNAAESVDIQVQQPPHSAPSIPDSPPKAGTDQYEQKIEREMEAYRREEERREQERHSEKRHEVGHDASERRHEVGHDASERRHEVGHDASEKRREVGHDGSERRR